MKRLRNRLILAFFAATILPTAAILWTSVALIEHSLTYVGTEDLDLLSKSLQGIAREYYRQTCNNLKEDAERGVLKPARFAAGAFSGGPASLEQFWDGREPERFELSEPYGNQVHYLVRRGQEVWVYSRDLNGIRMQELTGQLRKARTQVERIQKQDLRKGFTYTLIFLSAGIWILAVLSIGFMANRISRPIQDLTAGLHRLANGDFEIRLNSLQHDEVGRAVQAFNHTADHLQQNRDRLVYLTQIASWQTLARKMAHELKNSLTPIRLTVEEILARSPAGERPFLEQAAQIVIEEVEGLERRVRAFSEFAAEPALQACRIDLNSMLEERIHFLAVAHPDVHYPIDKHDQLPPAWADSDRVKEILTNLLENAAEAAGPGGTVRVIAKTEGSRPVIEIHDSGPGLSEDARRSLFEPSISFKKNGMGLGLSISRKNALMAGGDLLAIQGLLGGAGFRLVLPAEGENHGS